MTTSCHGGSMEAAGPGVVQGPAEDIEASDVNRKGFGVDPCLVSRAVSLPESDNHGPDGADTRQEVPLLEAEHPRGVAPQEQRPPTAESGRNEHKRRSISAWLWEVFTDANIAFGMAFVLLPLMGLMCVLSMPNPRGPLAPLTHLNVPVMAALTALDDSTSDAVAYLTTLYMRLVDLGAPYGVFLHIKLLFRVLLVISNRRHAALIASGVAMIWDRYVTAAALDVLVGYSSKCHVCLPRTLPDLHGSKVCARLAWYRNPSGRSTEDILRDCAHVYETLTDGRGEWIQMSLTSGPYVQNFWRHDSRVVCVWVCALGVQMVVIVALIKMAVDDLVAVLRFYILYMFEKRRRAASRIQAFDRAARKCLWSTRYHLLDAAFWWLCRLLIGNRGARPAIWPPR
ncbi:uncharacterized protein LOC144134502 [Amblyomma americanum]